VNGQLVAGACLHHPVAGVGGHAPARSLVARRPVGRGDEARVLVAEVAAAVAGIRLGRLEEVAGLEATGHALLVRVQGDPQPHRSPRALDGSGGCLTAVAAQQAVVVVPVDDVHLQPVLEAGARAAGINNN